MSWRVAPAVVAALDEATRRWPRRSRTADGTIGDPAHARRGPASDHNPDERGVVLAFDLTHDPGNGCDAHALVERAVARRDPRIKYAISRRRIWSSARAAEGWRPYTGANPHQAHAHVSVKRSQENDTRDWWPADPAADDPEEDDMARLVKAKGKGAVYGTDGTQRWHVPAPAVLNELVRTGVYGDGKVHELSQATIDALPLVDRRS